MTGGDLASAAVRPSMQQSAQQSMRSAIGGLAGELVDVLLGSDPFSAELMSISGYEDAVPDLSAAALHGRRDRLIDIIVRCGQREPDPADVGSRILLSAVRDKAARSLGVADSRVEEYSVTTFPLSGVSLMLLIAARTRLADAAAAADYLTRCTRLAGYLDQVTAMLRDAARDGLLPVAPLVSDVIRQLSGYLAHPEQDPLLTPQPPHGWAGAGAWQAEIERVVRDSVHPAVGRYADLLTELLPASRPPERAGLLHVPGGVAAYACWVRDCTTLPLDPDELHRVGLDAVAEIENSIAELGSRMLGSRNAGEAMAALRADVADVPSDSDPLDRATAAIARAHERLGEILHEPLPPCAIEPMPAHMAEFGAPPYYSPPARDGSRPGAYLFNTIHPGAAGSWACDATAFHEGVPGHHVQFARLQAMPELPRLLTAFYVVPHGEGWGLYAEQLADELGLYSDDLQRLGMLACAIWRAVRLVVDTGLHARGWSVQRARQYALAHSPMPANFVSAEIDRYVAVPGQALGYHVGKSEILRLRATAHARLGAAFDLRDFHAAILDHGTLPLPVLGEVVDAWLDSAAAGTV